jgi:hypothetical protein
MLISVKVELHRIQNFLFAVPRLRDMVGANVLLGDTLRRVLVDLAQTLRQQPLVELLTEPQRAALAEFPVALEGDPVGDDDPQQLAKRGILARDGGHFMALFTSTAEAECFVQAADSALGVALPGVSWSIRQEAYPTERQAVLPPKSPPAGGLQIADLPYFQVCEESGRGPAIKQDRGDGDEADSRFYSAAVKARRDARGMDGAHDIVSLLRPALATDNTIAPTDFHAMCGGDYMAVIHADGNGVGRCAHELDRPTTEGGDALAARLRVDAGVEALFHHYRVLVRTALCQALKTIFPKESDRRGFQVLMVGGDDVLLVCQAKRALPLLVAFISALKALQSKPCPFDELTMGCGVVIANPAVPFHHLHDLAETLAASAKRLKPDGRSINSVDWMVSTDSRAGDPIAQRRREAVIHYKPGVNGPPETLVLSQRPLPVLGGDGATALASLEGLLQAVGNLQGDRGMVARSQLRHMAQIMPLGRRSAELAFKELPESTRKGLQEHAGLTAEGLWTLLDQGGRYYGSAFVDLVETYEITHLGNAVTA